MSKTIYTLTVKNCGAWIGNHLFSLVTSQLSNVAFIGFMTQCFYIHTQYLNQTPSMFVVECVSSAR